MVPSDGEQLVTQSMLRSFLSSEAGPKQNKTKHRLMASSASRPVVSPLRRRVLVPWPPVTWWALPQRSPSSCVLPWQRYRLRIRKCDPRASLCTPRPMAPSRSRLIPLACAAPPTTSSRMSKATTTTLRFAARRSTIACLVRPMTACGRCMAVPLGPPTNRLTTCGGVDDDPTTCCVLWFVRSAATWQHTCEYISLFLCACGTCGGRHSVCGRALALGTLDLGPWTHGTTRGNGP